MSRKNERIKKKLLLLQQIRDGQKHTKANAVLAPLSQNDLVRYRTTDTPYYRITDVWLTDNGKITLKFYEQELAAGRLD